MDEQDLEIYRREAAEEAIQRSVNQAAKTVDAVLGDRQLQSLETVKTPLRQARKPRMRLQSYYVCDRCNQAILDADSGYIIHGNVYVADPSCRGGLIGNNFPDVRPGDKIEVTDVQENVFCHTCLFAILKPPPLQPAPPKPKRRPVEPSNGAGELMRHLREMDL